MRGENGSNGRQRQKKRKQQRGAFAYLVLPKETEVVHRQNI